MPALALLSIFLIVLLLANCTCAGLLEYPTHASIIEEAQPSTRSSMQPPDDETFWRELGDLVGDEDALRLRGPPLQNLPHQPHFAIQKKEQGPSSTRIHTSDRGIHRIQNTPLSDRSTISSSLDNKSKIENKDTGEALEDGNYMAKSSTKEDDGLIHVAESEESMSEDEPSWTEPQSEKNEKLLHMASSSYQRKMKRLQLLELQTVYKLAGEKNLDVFRPQLHQFVNKLKLKGPGKSKKEDPFSITKITRDRLSFAIKSSLLQIRTYPRFSRRVAKNQDSKAVSKVAFTFLKYFWRLALTRKSDKKSPYYHIHQTPIVKKFLQKAKIAVRTPGSTERRMQAAAWSGTEAFVYFLWEVSTTASQKHAIGEELKCLGKEYNLQTSLLLKVQVCCLNYLREQKALPVAGSDLAEVFRKTYRNSILCHSKILGQAALKHFQLKLEDFLKFVWNLYDHKLQIFQDTTIEAIINRVSYLVKSSFLKVLFYSGLRFGAKLKPEFVNRFYNKTFNLLKYFCEFALFGEVDETRRDFRLEENFQKAGNMINSRVILSIDEEDEAVGEWISWHATEFLVWWCWNQKLTSDQKTQIIDSINFRGRRISMSESDYRRFDEDLGAIPDQNAEKLNKEHLVPYFKSMGQDALTRLAPLNTKEPLFFVQPVVYLMQTSFLKIIIFASFRMGGLTKADFVDGYEEKAIHLLKNFWLLAFLGKSDHAGEELKKENSMNLEEILENVRKVVDIYSTDERKLESSSWHAVSFCIKWLWHENVEVPLKTKIYYEILRLKSLNTSAKPHWQSIAN
ncbi:hypothetical protein O181_009945 [Austropuccinia psidii MF-1]|uniref:Uncharacterized protein n=1 Tax=Austropuccinia psidii MF-1 TaxID=1389203 RepID=A0A9Q3GKE4_9BASI|nr:hypothetical protein [Austropuccinia psidii MF-1]